MESFKPEWHNEIIAPGKRPDKYQLDLWRANEIIFMEAGVKPENIHTTNICTMCNHEYLFSHRKVGNERGNMGAFLGRDNVMSSQDLFIKPGTVKFWKTLYFLRKCHWNT